MVYVFFGALTVVQFLLVHFAFKAGYESGQLAAALGSYKIKIIADGKSGGLKTTLPRNYMLKVRPTWGVFDDTALKVLGRPYKNDDFES